jgi:pimeloyl-ACP methyl ester carboxylesterase
MRTRTLTLLPLLTLLTSCYYLQSTSVPIKTIEYKNQPDSEDNKRNRQLMVLLPGIGDRASVFNKFGVIDAIHKQSQNTDVIAVEAHFKYYQARTIVERLREDTIKPAIAAGYKQIYLGGTSLGGFGSLLYLKQYPDEISKIFILAPYLGDEQDYRYLIENGVAPQPLRDVNIWPWLTGLPEETKNKMLEKYLSEKNVVSQDGKHNWITWAKLWPSLLEKQR